MVSRVFSSLARTFERTFREDSDAIWQRFDADHADPIPVIFARTTTTIDAAGIKIVDGQPRAYVRESVLRSLAPGRDIDALIDNRDTLSIGNTVYAVESCMADGYGMMEVIMSRRSV